MRRQHATKWQISLRIRYDARSALVSVLSLVLLAATLLARQAWAPRRAAAGSAVPATASTDMRHYYLTANPVPNASQAPTACAPGYHMASIWEIVDPSHLRYNTTLGATAPDAGQGPPVWLTTDYHGWVRTGHIASSLNITGLANCDVWTSSSSDDRGTTATLPTYLDAGMEDLHVWDVTTWPCSTTLRVWCVEDVVRILYLPLIHAQFQHQGPAE